MVQELKTSFHHFISYNHIDLEHVTSFFYRDKEKYICFGALEPLVLNSNRYCMSMVVHESYRHLGYGTQIVRFLINYLSQKGLECNARCYVLNDVSKKTLLKSGMKISNRLFRRVCNDD